LIEPLHDLTMLSLNLWRETSFWSLQLSCFLEYIVHFTLMEHLFGVEFICMLLSIDDLNWLSVLILNFTNPQIGISSLLFFFFFLNLSSSTSKCFLPEIFKSLCMVYSWRRESIFSVWTLIFFCNGYLLILRTGHVFSFNTYCPIAWTLNINIEDWMTILFRWRLSSELRIWLPYTYLLDLGSWLLFCRIS
jgi:hypothetical protein